MPSALGNEVSEPTTVRARRRRWCRRRRAGASGRIGARSLATAAGMDGEAFVLAANMAGEAKIIGSVSFLLCKFFFFFFSFSTAFLSCKVAAAYGQGLVSDRKYGQHRIEWKMPPWKPLISRGALACWCGSYRCYKCPLEKYRSVYPLRMLFDNGQGWNHFAGTNKSKQILDTHAAGSFAGCREHLSSSQSFGSPIGIAQNLLLGRQASIFLPVPSLIVSYHFLHFASGSQVLKPGF